MLNFSAFGTTEKPKSGLNLSAFQTAQEKQKSTERVQERILTFGKSVMDKMKTPTGQVTLELLKVGRSLYQNYMRQGAVKREMEEQMKRESPLQQWKSIIKDPSKKLFWESAKYLPEEMLEIGKKTVSYAAETFGLNRLVIPVYKKTKEGQNFIQAYKETWEDVELEDKMAEIRVNNRVKEAEKAGASRWEISKIASESPMAQRMAFGAICFTNGMGFTTTEQIKQVIKTAVKSKNSVEFVKLLAKKQKISIGEANKLFENIGLESGKFWSIIKNWQRGGTTGALTTKGANLINKKIVAEGLKNLKAISLNQSVTSKITSSLLKGTALKGAFALKGKPFTSMTAAKALTLEGKVPATTQQMAEAHIIAKSKEMISSLGKVKPQYRALAKGMTGKTSMKEMTKVEAESFLTALKQIQPRFIHGVIKPPVIPTTKQLTTPDFFVREFKKPTFATHLTPSDRYARTLGTYDLIEPLIKAKTKLLLERQKIFNWLDNKEKEVFKLEKVSLLAKAKAGIKAKPTVAHEKWFDLLDKNTTAVDAGLTGKSAEVFDELRGLTESILQRTNEVRLQVGLDPIQSLKSYITHIEDVISKKVTKEKYPFPEEIKYWLNYIQPKHIFNPTALHRFLEDKPSLLKNPFKALKTMAAMDLKQIYLEKPNLLFKEQLSALKGQIPADTKKWTELYVNQVIKGFPTPLDEMTNNTLNTLGITKVLDKMLAPFGRTVGINPAREISGALSRLIHDAVIWGRMKLVIRNHTQKLLTLGLYDTKSFAKAMFPAGKDLQKLIKSNDFWKISNREFMERLPEGMLGKLEQIGYKPYGHSHISNIGFSMKTAYYASMDLVKNPKYAKLGWTEEDAIKEMEFGANTTQYWYNTMGMPDIYRSAIGRTFGVLQSWWMNYTMKYWREMLSRGFTGKTGWGKEIPVKWRLGALRHIIASLLFVEGTRRALGWDYKRIALFAVLPTYLSPPAQIVTGIYNYMFATSDWQKTKAKNQILSSWKAFVPGSMAWRDFYKAQEESNLEELFFYTEKEKPTTGGLVAPGGSTLPKRKKLIAP